MSVDPASGPAAAAHAQPTGVLFVCLGNICRSPMGEAVFNHLARARGVAHLVHADSCGTGHWHVGHPPDPRTLSVARARGLRLERVARQLDPARDFARFRWILAMDRDNERTLLARGSPRQRTHLVRAFDPSLAGAPREALDVPDPYHHDGEAAFHDVHDMLARACDGLLDAVLRERDGAG